MKSYGIEIMSTPCQITVLQSCRDIERGVTALSLACPHMARAAAIAGLPPLRRWSPGFDGLVRIITGQQLSVASAHAILARLTAAVDPLEPGQFLATPDAMLRAAGLSASKVATLRALSAAIEDGRIDVSQLAKAAPHQVHEALTAVRGIGPWTADIWLVLCRGDRDAFAAGDLALQIAVQDLMALTARPNATELLTIAERWQPWRGVAARLLWAYYATLRAKTKA